MEFIFEYGLFLAKVVTLIFGLVCSLALILPLLGKQSDHHKGTFEVTHLNEQYENMTETIMLATLNSAEQKVKLKEFKETKKDKLKGQKVAAKKKTDDDSVTKRVYVLNFKGNVSASEVDNLREEVTAVLSQASGCDEVVLRLESPGGTVHGYGLAASQLDRIKKKDIPLTVCVDKVAASGGYAMACVADKILAAPFAIIGSIGVVAQIPNFNRLLKKNDIDFELLTAGEYKRTLTLFGENTDKGREKYIEDLEVIHELFKNFIRERRPEIDIPTVATGEVWLGARALEVALVDDIQTSDEYLVSSIAEANVYEIKYVIKKSLMERFGIATESGIDRLLKRWWLRLTHGTPKNF